MDATLRRAGLNLSDAMGSEEVVSFLAAHPHLLGGPGAAQLSAKLRLFASWRLAPPLRALLLARCPPLLAESEEQLQASAARQGCALGRCVCRWLRAGAAGLLRTDPSIGCLPALLTGGG